MTGRFDGELMRRLREGRGWTLRQMAKKAGMTSSTLHRAERRGLPTFTHAVAIAELLGLKVDAFVSPSQGRSGRKDRT